MFWSAFASCTAGDVLFLRGDPMSLTVYNWERNVTKPKYGYANHIILNGTIIIIWMPLWNRLDGRSYPEALSGPRSIQAGEEGLEKTGITLWHVLRAPCNTGIVWLESGAGWSNAVQGGGPTGSIWQTPWKMGRHLIKWAKIGIFWGIKKTRKWKQKF